MNSEIAKANNFYKLSQELRDDQVERKREYLEKALYIYRTELKNTSELTRSSLWKNIGVASLKLAGVFESKSELKLIIYHLIESISHLTWAWIERIHDRKSDWGEKVERNILECFLMAFSSMNGDVETERIPHFHLLDKMFEAIGPDVNLDYFRAKFRLTRAQYLYNCGVESFGVSDFKVTDRILEYCREEIEGGRKLWDKYDPHKDIEQLELDLYFLRCSCDSVRFRFQADEMFSKQVFKFDSDETDFGIFWIILDRYKSASLSCREKDLENEAIALSRQGRVYDQILKMKIVAKKYYKEAFELGIALQPRDLSQAKWFQECKFALERYQKENLEEERQKKETERKPYLDKLKKELDELSTISTSTLKDHAVFLKFVYKTHPAKSAPDFKFDESKVDTSNMKKILTKAIFHYHPDKQVKFEKKWQVLCEEITKFLTARYETFK